MNITDKSCPLRSSVQSLGGETPNAGLLTKVVCELGKKLKCRSIMQDVSIALSNIKAITRTIGVRLSISKQESLKKITSLISHAKHFKILHSS